MNHINKISRKVDANQFDDGGRISDFLSTRSEMFKDGSGKELSKNDLEKFLKLSATSDFKYFIRGAKGGHVYSYKGQLRDNDSSSGIFNASQISIDRLKEDFFPVKIQEEELREYEKEILYRKSDEFQNKYKDDLWYAVLKKFFNVFYGNYEYETAEDYLDKTEVTTDQVKARSSNPYSSYEFRNFSELLSWKDAYKMFKESLTKEELNSIQVSFNSEEYADAEEHDMEKTYSTLTIRKKIKVVMNHITIIPKFQRKKSIPKQLKDLQLLPLNEQFSKLTMSIISDDDLRPAMTGNFFDVENKKIVSTDAHKLTAINMPETTYNYIKQKYAKELNKELDEADGLIFHTIKQLQNDYNKLAKLISEKKGDMITFDEFVEQRAIEDGRYPKYDAVIPKQFIAEINVDYQKLYWYAKVLSDAKIIDDDNKINASNENEYQNKKIEYLKDSYVAFISPITHQIILTYTLDGQIQYIGFNANFICELLKFAMELNGKYFGKLGISSNSGAMVIELEDGLDSRKDSVGLIMPVILVNNPDYTIGQREFDTNVAMYYDLDTNSIVSDEVSYPIDESIGFVPVKGVLTAPRLQVEPQASQADNSSLILIINRLKGLRIALKVAKSENKPSIEKRIKGLEIAIKMQKDDLPFKNGGVAN